MTKITDKPMAEACANGDGTYDGRKLVRWLFEVTTGKAMSEEDAQNLVDEAKKRAEDRKNVRPARP